MSKKRNNLIVFWVLIAFLVSAYAAIRYFGASMTENLYTQNAIEMLNTITDGKDKQSLDYYLGVMEERVWGPASMIVSGILLLMLSLKFLKDSSRSVFAASIFAFLLLTKFDVLFFPPYGDAIGGPFAEAVWLFRHSFDYVGLSKEPIYIAGGAKVYLFSIYPTYLALLMKFIPSPKAFLVINHLIVFAMAAFIIALFRQILLKVFDEKISLLSSILLFSFPLFQSQTEAINMEIPLLFFSMLSIYYLANKRLALAGLMAVLAAMVKGVAVLICATMFLICILMFFIDEKHKFRIQTLLWGFFAFSFFVLKLIASVFLMHEGEDIDMVGVFAGWPSIKGMEVMYLFAVGIIIMAVHLFKEMPALGNTFKEKIASFWQKYYVHLILVLCVFAWFGLFINSYAVSPRYRLLLAPFSTFAIIYAVSLLIKSRRTIAYLLITGVMVSNLCSYGLFHGDSGPNYVLLERSLEYRNDLKLNMKVFKFVENHFAPHITIGAPFLAAQALALPELGFVERDIKVMIYGMVCRYGNIKNFERLDKLNLNRTVWIGFINDMPDFIEYPVHPKDRILNVMWVGNKKATLFMGGVAIEKVRLMMQYLDNQKLLGKYHP